MSGADEKIRAVIGRVAEDIRDPHFRPDSTLEAVLERRLLPILLAGQAMRDAIDVGKPKFPDELKIWDECLAVAQGQSEQSK